MKRTVSCTGLGVLFMVLCVLCLSYSPAAFVQLDTRASVEVGSALMGLGMLYAIGSVVSFLWMVDGAREHMRQGLTDTLGVAGATLLLFLASFPISLLGRFAGDSAAVALCSFVLGILPLTCYLVAERLREFGVEHGESAARATARL